MTQTTRVLLVDDHVLFREGLAGLLAARSEIELVGEAADGQEAVRLARTLKPDLVLMDIHMPVMTGLEAVKQIVADRPAARVVMLTVSHDEKDLLEAIKAGARGYILKNTRFGELMRMLQEVLAGEAVISSPMATKMLGELARRNRQPARSELTEREEEVLQLVANGEANKSIAQALDISENTVKKHLRNILSKLQLQNRVQLAVYATRDRTGAPN